jgi:hypothetical protein
MDEATPRRQFLSAMKRQRQEHSEGTIGRVRLESDNAVFNEILDRSAADLAMLITPTPYGPYPYAGSAVVFDTLRARWHHYGSLPAVDRSEHRKGGAALFGGNAVPEERSLSRRRARQDSP